MCVYAYVCICVCVYTRWGQMLISGIFLNQSQPYLFLRQGLSLNLDSKDSIRLAGQ